MIGISLNGHSLQQRLLRTGLTPEDYCTEEKFELVPVEAIVCRVLEGRTEAEVCCVSLQDVSCNLRRYLGLV